jgi:predicted ester cyclase
MSEQNKAVVRRLYEEHWNARNTALVSELFAPTVSLLTPDGALTGLDGASFLLQAYATAFPDFRLAIDDVVAEGDKVVVRYKFTGTHQGPLGDIAASGKRVSLTNGFGIFRLVAGKVNEGHLAWDKYTLLQQVGALGPISAAPTEASV